MGPSAAEAELLVTTVVDAFFRQVWNRHWWTGFVRRRAWQTWWGNVNEVCFISFYVNICARYL